MQHAESFTPNKKLIHFVVTNGIKNNLITKRDTDAFYDMLGPSEYDSKGKTTMKQSETIDVYRQLLAPPESIKTRHSDAEIVADVLHLIDVPFLTSISRHSYYVTVCTVDNLECPALEASLKSVFRSYAFSVLHVIMIVVDKNFRV